MRPPNPAGGPAPAIVADLSAGRAEIERRLGIAEAALRGFGVEPAVERVDGHEAVAEAVASARPDAFPVVLGDDRSIRAAAGARVAGAAGLGAGPLLGILAANRHVDFVRTFGIPPDQPAFAAERLVTAPAFPIDVGKVTYVDDRGHERTSHFVGLLEVGFGGAVFRREAKARIRRTAAFAAFWLTVLTYRAGEVRLTGERREFAAHAHDVIVGNTQYGRHGIRLSPRSFPGDGAFDLLIMTGPKSQQVRLLPKMFQGEHVPDDSIQEHRVRRMTIDAERPLPVHADGEYLGTTPVTVELLPEALTLRI
jgi:diacylglycerol kinase family enzyme